MLPTILLLLACGDDSTSDPGDTAQGAGRGPEGIALRADGWQRGDLHMHTDWSDGWDDLPTVIALGEYLASDTFVDAHSDYAGNGLDFLAITDHRTVDGQSDPGWKSDQLVLIGGEEFGGDGHAGLHGVHEMVEHDPDGDGTTIDDLVAAVAATHAQGATFSPNHPMLPDISWP